MNRLLHNWNLKLVSLILAVGLWSHVRGEVNPWETATFRVPLAGQAPPPRFLNLDSAKVPREVRVTLRAPRARLRAIKGFAPPNPLAPPGDAPLMSAGEVRASLDWELARLGAQDVPVKIQTFVEDAEVIGVRPAVVVAHLSRADEREIDVSLLVAPSRGYRIESARLDRVSARAYGPSEALARVVGARARVRSGPLKLGVERRVSVPLEAVDEAGAPIREVRIEPPAANAVAVLREEIVEKSVPLEARLLNAPPDADSNAVQVLPATLTVRGPLLEVEKIGSLRLSIDAAGARPANGVIEQRVSVKLPPRVQAVGSAEVLVRATVR